MFSAHRQIVRNGPKKGQDVFVSTNQDPANLLGMTHFHSDSVHLFEVFGFLDFQISRRAAVAADVVWQGARGTAVAPSCNLRGHACIAIVPKSLLPRKQKSTMSIT